MSKESLRPPSGAGVHVVVDGYVSDSSTFGEKSLRGLFDKMVTALEMKMLAEPHVYEVPVDPEVLRRVRETGNFEDEGGITAVAVISTSHMSIHCWPLQRFFSMDVFSCKDFDHRRAVSILRSHLGVSVDNVTVLSRNRPEERA